MEAGKDYSIVLGNAGNVFEFPLPDQQRESVFSH